MQGKGFSLTAYTEASARAGRSGEAAGDRDASREGARQMRIKTWMVAAALVCVVVVDGCGGASPADGDGEGTSLEELIEEIKALHAERIEEMERSDEEVPLTGFRARARVKERVDREVAQAGLEAALDAALVSGDWEDVQDRARLMFMPRDAAPLEIVTAVRDNVSEAVEFTRFT